MSDELRGEAKQVYELMLAGWRMQADRSGECRIVGIHHGQDDSVVHVKPQHVSYEAFCELRRKNLIIFDIGVEGIEHYVLNIPPVSDESEDDDGLSGPYEAFCQKLDQMPEGSARIDAIDDAIHRLQFERRWQLLSPMQVKHMCDESLTDGERAALDACRTEREREERIDMYARARYFRRCAWQQYLNGYDSSPPVGGQ